jgi:tetratricopeptide (TPR) repeat protein
MPSSWIRSLHAWLAVATLCVLSAWPSGALASQKAAAESLFQEGKRLMDQGDYEQACPKFQASLKAEPSVGAMLNLARCHELVGKTASAWAEYEDAAGMAARAGQPEREEGARDHAARLLPLLSKLTINVSEPAEGQEVKRGSVVVAAGSYGAAIAVDPGNYTIEASAPGRATFSTSVSVGPNADSQTVDVPALEEGAGDSSAPAPSSGGLSGIAIGGIVVAVVGVLALGAGIGTGVVALNKEKKLEEDGCGTTLTADCSKDLDKTETIANTSTAMFVVGGVFTAAGLAMVLFAPPADDAGDGDTVAVTPLLGPEVAGMSVQVRF